MPGVNSPNQAPMPKFFALAPLYRQRATRHVDIKFLRDDGTLSDAAVSTVFTSIDVESWVRRFLGDVDRFLTDSASVGVDGLPEISETRDQVVESKHNLASRIANQLHGVFDYSVYESDPGYQDSLQAARDALTERLRASLATAYDISVIVQCHTPASAASTESDAPWAFEHFFKTDADSDSHKSTSSSAARPPSCTDPDTAGHASPSCHAASDAHSVMAQLCAPRIPAPLRVYPSPPVIREQAALPTFDSPDGLQQLSLWSYRLICAHEFAAQDTLEIATEFNLPSLLPMQHTPPVGVDLFSAIAQYMAIADTLWALLEGRVNGANAYANAMKTFAALVETIAEHWHIRSPQYGSEGLEGDCMAEKSHSFGVRVTYSESGEAIKSVSLIRRHSPCWPRDTWLGVEVLLADGGSVPLTASQFEPSNPIVVYTPGNDAEIPASAAQSLQITWNGLNVSAFQNARSRISVVRNENLLYDPLRPEEATPSTSPVFLLKTKDAVANRNVAPLIERHQLQDISGDDLHGALENAIQSLFPLGSLVENTRATWRLDYSYELARSDTSPVDHSFHRARIPVAVCPHVPMIGIAQMLADAGKSWIETYLPESAGGGWILDVVLHSGLEPDANPLFRAELFYPIKENGALE